MPVWRKSDFENSSQDSFVSSEAANFRRQKNRVTLPLILVRNIMQILKMLWLKQIQMCSLEIK